jgi:tetratricopeptide (TPR) repeat protein
MRAKNYPQAAVWFQKRVDSGDKVSTTDYYNLGRAYYLMKEYGKSDSAFGKVTSLQETWAPGWLWRGKANAGLDPDSKQGLAKPYYEKYIELVSADSANITKYQRELTEANSYLAYYYLVQKDCTQSTIYWKRVLDLEPGNERAKDGLEIIKKNPKDNCR